jgi:PAS domain S-box-containing protein
MAPTRTRVLLVDDDERYGERLRTILQTAAGGSELTHTRTLAAAARELSRERFDAVLLDPDVEHDPAATAAEWLLRVAPAAPIILLMTHEDEDAGVRALQQGAQDFVVKGEITPSLLARSLRYARERAAARAELARRERYFRALTEHAYDIIVVLATTGELLYQSPSVQRVLGFTPEELNGGNVLDLVHEEDRERAATLLGSWPEALREADFFEFRLRRKDGSIRVLEALGQSLHGDPRNGIVVNARDVTERAAAETALRRTEEQLRQAHKMEAVGRLAGGIAHDFNNVLTAIFGYTDLLLDQLAPGDQKRADVEEIRRAADRAATLTRQLLAFSRRQVMQPRVIDLNAVTGNVERMLSRLVGAEIRVSFQPGDPLWPVRADPGQIEQVLLNLSINARDAMPEGGELVISTINRVLGPDDVRRLPGMTPGEFVALTVRDTGHGIPETVRPHIFEPFFTTKSQGKGTGLGLATVYGIVKQSGGGIYLEDSGGPGTAFTIYLPRVTEVVQQPDPASAGPLNR